METLLTCSSAEGQAQGKKSRTPVYSLGWAGAIVDKALQSYPRAWEIIMDVTALEKRQLAYLLACSDPSWPVLRQIVHLLDRWMTQQSKVGPEGYTHRWITPQMLSSLIKIGGKNAPEALATYLTGRISKLMLEEQVKREEGVGPDTPDILSGPHAEPTEAGMQYVFNFG